jgi:lipopolysaccharide/colanic/teichoic acid biosynthesis glycosyltransferase
MSVIFPGDLGVVGGAADAASLATAPRPRRRGPYRLFVKRALDVTAVLLAAPFVVPLVGLLAVAVARDGGGAFYTQPRIGRHGRIFRIWKLRTMVPDADRMLARHLAENPAARREWDETQKLRRDPRVTPVGRILRQSSLDELPQLWNVLRGEMSLVGPRPMMPDQRALYPGSAYYALLPGITGYWQTSARNATSFAARADYDAAYDTDLSLGTDIAVLLRTVRVVLRGTGC